MGAEIVSRTLPGVGVASDVSSRRGDRVGVVTRHDGVRELVVHAGDGAAEARVELAEDEASAVAELLGAPDLVERLADVRRTADRLVTEQLPVQESSPFAGRLLSSVGTRTRLRASIVAVLRSDAVHVAPPLDFMLHGGDFVLAVGTREGVDQLGHVLDGTG